MMTSSLWILLSWLPLLLCQDHGQSTFQLFEKDISWKAAYKAPWQTMPSLPPMPDPKFNGTARINDVDLWYAMYGAELFKSRSAGYSPVVFLHGGFANSDYYAHQIRHLEHGPYTLITVDSRAQGRSSDDLTRPLTYDAMAEDVIALMDYLEVDRFSTVGWSDGSCLSFDLAMNYSQRIDRVFAFGGTYSYENINATVMETETFSTYMRWVQDDFKRLSPSSGTFDEFEERMMQMWSSEPVWTAESFQKVPSLFDDPDAPIIWIVAGDSEEAVTRTTPGNLHSWIWGSSLVTLPSVSHFAMFQDPKTFNILLGRLLELER
ncbi:uncharacterized protein PV06_00536 [Exophiala oligosperma]|uniref:AB hydrolase-1 domain-containing protein n=1 Tax=Exophiala oligosperma TaxID=215243 RepID=A0A0D2DZ66_9EURO|nr:uncharacterized protein PV06_00536 [Exophiala oligosperma]KIW47880.1 hypothetical protein PV06_00536 [Exophiala oligosperma]